MGEAKVAALVTRLKREDHKRTKHDSQFSKWKVLIGPDDWEDHSVGKEGVARYRVDNLPRSSSSGLYELAIYLGGSSSRNNPGKLDPNKVVVVYLGESDNVRTRLQQYGRTGAHLGRSDSGDKGCGYFEDIFSRGYSILYKWVPMENKADAYRTEAQLLNTFDYAWNKGSNGGRRHDDILLKLDKRASSRKLLAIFSKKQVGIKIKASKPLSEDKEFGKYADGESYNFLWQVFKFSRSQPRLVLDRGGSNENDTIACGVVLVDGSICRRPPAEGRKRCAEHKGKKTAEGRKRCAEHKGKKTKGYSVRLSTTEKSQLHYECSEYAVSDSAESCVGVSNTPSIGPVPLLAEDYPEIEHSRLICGVAMDDDSYCRRQPISGRKRCDLHKGMRVASLLSGLDAKSASHVFDVDSRINSNNYGCSNSSTSICGASTSNGSFCQRTVKGNGRCWQHLINSNNYGCSNSSTSICGATTSNGSFCQRTVKGNGRCWQHLNNGYSSSIIISNGCSTQYSNYGGSSSSICGAPTHNGSLCRRRVKGNGRCWQH